MSIPYSYNYSPPFPVLVIHLAPVDERALLGPLTGLVDTGSDGTVVPMRYLLEMDIPLDYSTRLRGSWGNSRAVNIYTIDLLVNDLRIPNIEVVGDVLGDEILLGRNFLNRFTLVLDGHLQIADLFEQRPHIRQKGIV